MQKNIHIYCLSSNTVSLLLSKTARKIYHFTPSENKPFVTKRPKGPTEWSMSFRETGNNVVVFDTYIFH